jgi:hypothetical protein
MRASAFALNVRASAFALIASLLAIAAPARADSGPPARGSASASPASQTQFVGSFVVKFAGTRNPIRRTLRIRRIRVERISADDHVTFFCAYCEGGHEVRQGSGVHEIGPRLATQKWYEFKLRDLVVSEKSLVTVQVTGAPGVVGREKTYILDAQTGTVHLFENTCVGYHGPKTKECPEGPSANGTIKAPGTATPLP